MKNKNAVPPQPGSIIREQEAEDTLLSDKFGDGAIAFTDVNEEQMVATMTTVNEILNSLRQYSPKDIDNIQEVFHASAMAIMFLKDQLASLQPMPSALLSMEPLLSTLALELTNAESHLKGIEGFVPKQYARTETKAVASVGTGRRILSSQHESSPKKYSRQSSISTADYYLRAQSRHLQRGNDIGKSYESQQGYHPARQSRRDMGGQRHRRMNHDDGQCAPPPGDSTYGKQSKQEQCLRLAECSVNYNLYDLFVYFFGDDIDFDTGSIDDKIRSTRDLYNIPSKVRTVSYHSIMNCLPLMLR
jgi:hypothetical protein